MFQCSSGTRQRAAAAVCKVAIGVTVGVRVVGGIVPGVAVWDSGSCSGWFFFVDGDGDGDGVFAA